MNLIKTPARSLFGIIMHYSELSRFHFNTIYLGKFLRSAGNQHENNRNTQLNEIFVKLLDGLKSLPICEPISCNSIQFSAIVDLFVVTVLFMKYRREIPVQTMYLGLE